ncbi:MAG: hypothetical protein HRT77_15820, partial [Halioglobus sp.]|nr:hypothetical protein [Halioglobus sp.]
MRGNVALQRYLQRHIERGLPAANGTRCWQQVLVIPAYRESPALLGNLRRLPSGPGKTLVILVLNRPDQDRDTLANAALRNAVHGQPALDCSLFALNQYSELYLLDLEQLRGTTPASQGVGLARKTGCDLALQWMSQGAISDEWIYCTDADALLPPGYFERLRHVAKDTGAAVFPFQHVNGDSYRCDRATALYELRLHHHVLGLEYAGSPYAYHSLGSCLALRGNHYAQVRGFPRRAGGEDFYLLNKLRKLGPIDRLKGAPIRIRSRLSSRVPFGTGPAVRNIATEEQPEAAAVFYHPVCYHVLSLLLRALTELAVDPTQRLARLLVRAGLSIAAAEQVDATLRKRGFQAALTHCQR